jgi:tetratricopeptide (TPR) repeat protein
MEILKKSVIVALFLGMQFAVAQEQKALQDAFSKSYTLETGLKYNEAIETLKSLNANENYPVQLRLGWLYYLGKRYDESVTAYRKAASLMPASVEALNGLVSPLAAQNKWNDVEQTYLTILKNDSQNSLINFRLGQIYYNRKDYAKAEKYFTTSLNLYPFDYDAMLMTAWDYYFLGKFNEAKELFNKVLLYKPSDASAKDGLAHIK